MKLPSHSTKKERKKNDDPKHDVQLICLLLLLLLLLFSGKIKDWLQNSSQFSLSVFSNCITIRLLSPTVLLYLGMF